MIIKIERSWTCVNGSGIERKGRKREVEEVERHVWTENVIEQYHGKCESWICIQRRLKKSKEN